MSLDIQVKLSSFNRVCRVEFGRYLMDRSISMRLIDPDTEEPIITATVCLPELDYGLPERFVIIRNYGDTAGLPAVLVRAGVIEEPFRRLTFGIYGTCHADIAALTPDALAEFKRQEGMESDDQ